MRDVSTVLEGVTSRPLTKESMAWCFLPYELFTMQRYLMPQKLKQWRFHFFDNWAAQFGKTTTTVELKPEGKGFQSKKRFASFINVPELIRQFKEVADIITNDMLNLKLPEGKYHTVESDPSELQQELVESLSDRADVVRARNIEPDKDNLLLITTDGRKIALDQRLYEPMLPDSEDSKISACVANVLDVYKKTDNTKGTQLIFSDLGTPSSDGFNVYDDIKTKLVAKGIPEKEIAFIHSYNTDKQKSELFAKVRKGDIRVLIGSTAKMGAGVNVQKRLAALHNLDVPWVRLEVA